MQYIPCNSALLAQETLFLTQKGTFFAQRSPKSASIATNLNLRQKSVCLGSKFSSESELFGGCHPYSRATSATLSDQTLDSLLIISKGQFRVQIQVTCAQRSQAAAERADHKRRRSLIDSYI